MTVAELIKQLQQLPPDDTPPFFVGLERGPFVKIAYVDDPATHAKLCIMRAQWRMAEGLSP